MTDWVLALGCTFALLSHSAKAKRGRSQEPRSAKAKRGRSHLNPYPPQRCGQEALSRRRSKGMSSDMSDDEVPDAYPPPYQQGAENTGEARAKTFIRQYCKCHKRTLKVS